MTTGFTSDTPTYIQACPLVFEWCEYKGEVWFGALNYEKSLSSKRCMIDLHYCATVALNGIVSKTVRFDKDKFKILNKRTNAFTE